MIGEGGVGSGEGGEVAERPVCLSAAAPLTHPTQPDLQANMYLGTVSETKVGANKNGCDDVENEIACLQQRCRMLPAAIAADMEVGCRGLIVYRNGGGRRGRPQCCAGTQSVNSALYQSTI